MFWRLRAQWHADRLGFTLRDSHRFDITETIQKPGNISLRLPRYLAMIQKKTIFWAPCPSSSAFWSQVNKYHLAILHIISVVSSRGHPFPQFCSANHASVMLFQVAVAAAASTGSGLGGWYTLTCRKIHDMKLLWQIICQIYHCVVKYVLILNISIHHTYETPM